nr:reverse transcriptase domain-containing protein [Tanacetum cinerariifolium]
ACLKVPTEITKIVRKANGALVAFKEIWFVETGFITVPKTVDEMMTRLDDFIRSEEAFASTKLPKGEASETPKNDKTEDYLSRFSSAANSGEWPMPVWCRMFQQTLDGSTRGWFENLSGGSIDGWIELRQQFTTRFSTIRACLKVPTEITKIVRKANGALVAFKEIWFVETGFITGVPEVMKISSFMDAHKCPELAKPLPTKKENQDKYCDYHGENGHYTNDCFQLRRHLEIALESEKLNHLIKDVRERGRGNEKRRDARKDKVINMIRSWPDDMKRNSIERGESWMKAPMVFPPLSMEDASDEPLIVEAIMEGDLVRRVYVDQGASVEVMDLVGFSGGVVKPLGKIELEKVFDDGGLFSRVMINHHGAGPFAL